MTDAAPDSVAADESTNLKDESTGTAKAEDEKANNPPKSMDIDELYPTFWGLQKTFAYPPRVFDAKLLDDFKASFAATLTKFKEVPKVMSATVTESRRGIKRTAEEVERDDFANSFNPKYLTSRELFQLEVGYENSSF